MEQLLRRFIAICIFITGITSAFSGEDKPLRSNLNQSLNGVSLVSSILIGSKAIPAGYQADYPINTFVNMETGEVSYRIEWLWMRMGINTREMIRSFRPGTRFKVTELNLNDEWLELKLESGSGDSARLKLIFGRGWQEHLDSAVVFERITHILTPEAQAAIPASPSISASAPKHQSFIDLASFGFHRSPTSPAIPGRISETDMQGLLLGLAEEQRVVSEPVLGDVVKMAKGIIAFQRANRNRSGITSLLDRLGNDLVPHSTDDVREIIEAYRRCVRTAQLSQAHNERGKLLGPGAGDSDYRELLLNEMIATKLLNSASKNLEKSIARNHTTQDVRSKLLAVEAALDGNDLKQVNIKFIDLKALKSENQVNKYLYLTQSLQYDIKTYLELNEKPVNGGIVPRVQFLMAAKPYSLKPDLPITQQLLRERIPIVSTSVRHSITGMPLISNVPVPARLTTTEKNAVNEAMLESALRRIESGISRMDAALAPQGELASLINADMLPDVQSLLNQSESTSLQNKVRYLKIIQASRSTLESDLKSLKEKLSLIRIRRQALEAERSSLVRRIVNNAIVIVMLNEKFWLTGVLEYKYEAEKQRKELDLLMVHERALLTRPLSNAVQAEYERIQPGLTASQAVQVRFLIRQLKYLP